MTNREYIHAQRERAHARNDARRELYARFSTIDQPISAEIAAFYDSRRLTEEDVDAMAELDTESRTYSRSLPPHE